MASSNSDRIYPDGSRFFTMRELARCQTFADSHIFGEVRVERQSMCLGLADVVGNAVPPLFAQRIFESVVKELRETDAMDCV
jgi:site-specific DNA-cytosine methylase